MLGDYKILVAIAILVIVMIWLKVKKAKDKELKMIAEDKLRDHALNRALANDLYGDKEAGENIESLPYEVDYNQSQLNNRQTKRDKMMIQITACSELSKRKFMIELKDVIKIGRAKENTIVIKDSMALPVHCEIFRHVNDVYVKDYSGNRTLLSRKKQQVYVDEKGIKVRTGDKIVIGNTVLEVTIMGEQNT
ncbi:FHA domain-containing protein [Cellulosilyticum sp. ST5]|uniref:FHA domain-containing protein n=1 Tax=Cellulosilyticum sp. ST5 TaxID=3055805 RepID=UPI003977A8A6